MGDEIKDAEKYLVARLAECQGRPDLHKNTMAVYNNYIKVIRERPGDYVKEAGDMFAVMRAEQLDRNEAFAMLYEKFGQDERVQAYDARAEAVKQASGYGDFHLKLGAARKATDELVNMEYKKRDLLAELCRCIVAWKVAIPSDRGTLKANAVGFWNSLRAYDSELSWDKLKAHPPYRNSVYYNNGQFALLEKWFRELSA